MPTMTQQIDWLDDNQRTTALNKLPKFQQQLFTVECAYSVLHIHENKYPEDKQPRIVLEKLITCLLNPTKENKTALIQARNTAYYAFFDYAANAVYSVYSVYYAIRAVPEQEQQTKQDWINKLYHNALKEGKEFNPNWKTQTSIQLAKQIVKTRDFSMFSILADALQDNNCNDEELLNHLRHEECYSSDWIITKLLTSG